MILLDTSVLIDLFRKKNKEKSFFFSLLDQNSEFAISAITHYEIGIGNEPAQSSYWKELYSNLTVITFDQNCSEAAIDIYKDLKKQNKIIDLADLLIGACAVAYDLKLATLNKKHFQRIKNLQLI